MPSIDQLYRSCDPEQEQDFVFDHRYNKDLVVRLRPFSIHKDLDTFNQWINKQFHGSDKKMSAPSYFDGSYFRTILLATNAHSLWGMINGQPAFQVDLYKATEHQLPFREKGLSLMEGDVFLQVIISPDVIGEPLQASWILPACIHHCFNHTGVDRIILVNDVHDVHYRWLAEKASPTARWPLKNERAVYLYELIPGISKK